LAAEKYVADWRDNPVLPMPAEKVVHAVGAPDAPVQVVVFGDYQEPNTAKLDAQLRGWIEKNEKSIRYTWRHFPGDSKCNPQVSKVFFEHGCLTSKAAEAAATLGGEAAYWKMHAWLLSHQAGMSEQAVKTGATAVGLDAEALAGAIQGAPVGLALMEDIQAAAALGVGQIPCVYVNGKLVPRWSREGDNVMERIIDEAAKRPAR
jgi:protein-disulfide isomerase